MQLTIVANLFFILLVLSLLSSKKHSATTTMTSYLTFSNETDRRALLAIKDQIDVDPFQVVSSWNDSLHFCNWQGVNCSRRHQRVTALNLVSLSLSGTLSPHIGNLSFLRKVDLGDNHFHGAIPQEIGRLSRLRELVLWNNSFGGHIPANLSHCSKLETINFNTNVLTGRIPAELGSLSRLSIIGLARNNFSGSIPPSLGNLSYLSRLSLMENNLQGNIPDDLGRLSNLGFFQLSVNKLSGTVPMELLNISSLYLFSVVSNSLHGTLPPDLFTALPKLEYFFLGENQFSGPIPHSLANASELIQLSISANHFSGPPPLNLGAIQNLETLQLSDNPIFSTSKNNDNYQFLRSLSNCSKLQRLDLAQTNLTGEFPAAITNLSTQLTMLALRGNFLSGSISKSVGNLRSLVYLNMERNFLSGSIPYSIGKLTKLQVLALDRNKLSGNIPASVGNMTSLSLLYLGDNMLEGKIPISLADCKFLQFIDLGFNRLTGELPVQVFGLSSLSAALILTFNYLSGPLPLEVGNLNNIQQIQIAENELTGEIPSTIGNCLMLEFLDLGGNHLEGSIPSSFEQMRGIQVLNLSDNNLSGKIPGFFGNFLYLTSLDMSFNDLDGQVPDVGIFANIGAFNISGNQNLCGGIWPLQLPPCPNTTSINKKKKHIPSTVIVAPIVGVVVCTIILSAFIYWIQHRKRRIPSSPIPGEKGYTDLSYSELAEATDQFSSANLIGKGSYGSVYKGCLKTDEKLVAVKVFDLDVQGSYKSFFAEFAALRNIRHRNLIKIISSCSCTDSKGQDFKALVYEFMPNGNLDCWLHPNSPTEPPNTHILNLVQRLDIAIDVANALEYLHHYCHKPVVHCDLKPSNVLLDGDLVAHVGDFGLARFLLARTTSSQSQTSCTGIQGTLGYIAPEYGMHKKVSTQGDMYSYGVMLLEMFTGKRPVDGMFNDNLSLHSYVEYALLNDQAMVIVDSRMILEEEAVEDKMRIANVDFLGAATSRTNDKIKECLTIVLWIGVKCSIAQPRKRMHIRDALKALHGAKKLLHKQVFE